MAKTKKQVAAKPEKKKDIIKIKSEEEISIEKKLVALYTLQEIDSQIDKIRIIRGELPLEVQDLEDDIAGLETRISNHQEESESLKTQVTEKENIIKESGALIKKYETQQKNVRNNREFDSLTKEIEYQNLEIELANKRKNEFNLKLDSLSIETEKAQEKLKEKSEELKNKKEELDDIVAETEKEEKTLVKTSQENEKLIEERLRNAYTRIRKKVRNGLAVVQIERDACGGCFSKIPPQHQLDIRMHKKIIVCKYCGRILVDEEIANEVNL